MSLLQHALAAPTILMSSAGMYAGQDLDAILAWKIGDIRHCGSTIWLVNSNKGTPDTVQGFCRTAGMRFVLFIQPTSKKGKGPTTGTEVGYYSTDRKVWKDVAHLTAKPTGFVKSNTTGLWMDDLEGVSPPAQVNFGDYIEIASGADFRGFSLIDNAIPVSKARSGVPRMRRVVAVGRLASPFAVWLRY